MRVFILAAGRGERLGSIVNQTPKPLLSIFGEPIMGHTLRWLSGSGITDISMNLHYLADEIRAFCGNGSQWGVRITYIFEESLLGTAGAIKNGAHTWIDPFLVICGDNFFPSEYSLAEFYTTHETSKADATIGVYTYTEDPRHKGVICMGQEGRITQFIEKPSTWAGSSLINGGLYILTPSFVQNLPNGYSDFGRDIFPVALTRGDVLVGHLFSSQVIAVDTPELYSHASQL